MSGQVGRSLVGEPDRHAAGFHPNHLPLDPDTRFFYDADSLTVKGQVQIDVQVK